VRVGLVSNSHRCLASFQTHFELQGLISATVSSSDHGMMKPHPSIFEAALKALEVEPAEAIMVGDSVSHDVEGARRLGMRAVLLSRSPSARASCPPGVPIIESLRQLPELLELQTPFTR